MDLIVDPAEIEALQEGPFYKATASDGANGCVETVPAKGGHVLMRDTKNREAGAILIRRDAFAVLVTDIKAGRYDDLI